MGTHLITGGAGFVSVNLTRQLLARGECVIAVDDLSRGKLAFLDEFEANPHFHFVKQDCSAAAQLRECVLDFHRKDAIAEAWLLAANSDIPAGVTDPHVDLSRTFMTTFATLLVVRELGIPIVHFASSSAVYGDHSDLAVAENNGPLEPISNYGAMKLASEAQIRAAVESYLKRANIFRFPNVVGLPATHGIILDLIRKACHSSNGGFDVLGDGTQQKVYLHIADLVEAMLYIRDNAKGRYNVYNIGPQDDGVSVRGIAEAVRDRVALGAELWFSGGDRGWVGDVPRFRYDTGKLAALGWRPRMGSSEAIARAVDEIAREEAGG